jgi:uncharacterized membrane protein YciS (DUF1049 family)
MDHADIVNLAIFAGSSLVVIIIAVVGWLWRQGQLITRNHVRSEEIEKRLDRLEQQIMAALVRIETKVDRKADR